LKRTRLTLTLFSGAVDANTSDEDIMNDGEDALTADPAATPRAKTNIVKHGGLVEEDATRVNGTCKRDLVRMEEVKGGFVLYFVRVIPEDLDDGVGRKEDVRIRTQIWKEKPQVSANVHLRNSVAAGKITMDRHKCLVH
jgi:hypothetical protein